MPRLHTVSETSICADITKTSKTLTFASCCVLVGFSKSWLTFNHASMSTRHAVRCRTAAGYQPVCWCKPVSLCVICTLQAKSMTVNNDGQLNSVQNIQQLVQYRSLWNPKQYWLHRRQLTTVDNLLRSIGHKWPHPVKTKSVTKPGQSNPNPGSITGRWKNKYAQNVQITQRVKALWQNYKMMKNSYTKYIKSAYNDPHKYFIPYSLITGLTIPLHSTCLLYTSPSPRD